MSIQFKDLTINNNALHVKVHPSNTPSPELTLVNDRGTLDFSTNEFTFGFKFVCPTLNSTIPHHNKDGYIFYDYPFLTSLKMIRPSKSDNLVLKLGSQTLFEYKNVCNDNWSLFKFSRKGFYLYSYFY